MYQFMTIIMINITLQCYKIRSKHGSTTIIQRKIEACYLFKKYRIWYTFLAEKSKKKRLSWVQFLFIIILCYAEKESAGLTGSCVNQNSILRPSQIF